MAEKRKTSKFEKLVLKFILYFVICIVVSFFLAIIIASYINYGTLSAESIGESLGTGEFITYFPILIAVCLLSAFLFFPPSTKSSSSNEMKGKDELENQRFLREDELDSVFKQNAYFDELHKRDDIEGWPVNVKLKKNRLKIHFTHRQTHMLILGTTGSGKTVTFVEPTIQILSEMKTKPSMFITDLKGELFAHHTQKLKDDGYDVKLLDLVDPYNSLQWNPLELIYNNYQRSLHLKEEIMVHTNDSVSKYNFIQVGEINDAQWYEFQGKAFSSLDVALSEAEIERSTMVNDCYDDLHEMALAICPPNPNAKEPIWDTGAKDYVLAVLWAMLEDSENPNLGMTVEKFNFYNMYKIVMNKEDDLQHMQNYFKGRGPLSRTNQLSMHVLNTQARQTRDSFFATMATNLSMFADNAINNLTSRNEIDFSSFDEKPTAFFVKIPEERKTRYLLASLCVSQAYKALVRKARENERKNGKNELARPVYYVMDEFGNLPPVSSDLDKMVTISRSKRIYLAMIIQSYEQFDSVYGEKIAKTVRNNINTEGYIGSPSTETREAFSRKLGNKTVKIESKSSSKGTDGKTTPGTTTQYQSVPLIYPSDLVKMKYGRIIFDIYSSYPLDAWIDSYMTTKGIYKIGKMETPYVTGKRLNESKIFYDIKERNRKVLGY